MTNESAAPRVALLTPAGTGAIAVIRVAGPGAGALVRPFLRAGGAGSGPYSALQTLTALDRIQRATIHDGDEPLDDVLVVLGEAGGRGEVIDLCAHGGVRVVQRIIAAFTRAGGVFCPPGESLGSDWPAENLIEREAWGALASAQTRRGARFLLRLRETLPAELRRIAGLAGHDLSAAQDGLRRMIAASAPSRRLIEGCDIALVGPPNAGKSTLANRFLGREQALVSSRPGTTLDWSAEPTAIQGVPVTILDTPGYGDHGGPLGRRAMERAARRIEAADLKLLVFDGSMPAPEWAWRHGHGDDAGRLPSSKMGPALLVLNKCDLGTAWQDGDIESRQAVGCYAVSAAAGAGMDGLERGIVGWMGLAGPDEGVIGLFTDRQCRLAAELLDECNGDQVCEEIWATLLGQVDGEPG